MRARRDLAVAAVVVAFALARPVGVGYWNSNGAPLVRHLASNARADDPVMLSATGVFLAAFYGPWPVTTHQTETNAQGVDVTVARDRTLYLPRSNRDGNLAAQFLHQFRSSDRVWYLGHRLRSERAVEAMTNAGYAVQVAEASTDYRLFHGTR